MPRTSTAKNGRVAPGIYSALLTQERDRNERDRVDPRWRYTQSGQRGEPPPAVITPRNPLLDALEASQKLKLQGRNLHRHMKLRRDQAFDWFEVGPDDRVIPISAG